jgi:hypothetical protein
VAKTPESPVSDLWVANQAATFFVDGQEILTHPGMIVTAGSPILAARPGLFEPLLLAVHGVQDEPGTAAAASALVVDTDGDGLGYGSEMILVRRFRTREAPPSW